MRTKDNSWVVRTEKARKQKNAFGLKPRRARFGLCTRSLSLFLYCEMSKTFLVIETELCKFAKNSHPTFQYHQKKSIIQVASALVAKLLQCKIEEQ